MSTLLLLLTLLAFSNAQSATLCPSDSGLVVSARLSFLANSNIPSETIPSEDSLTYNHSLTQPFNNQPGVIISIPFNNSGITSFSSQPTPFLMFSVKPLPMNSLSSLPLLLRFFQRYSSWNHIKISFLAEDRNDMEADYY